MKLILASSNEHKAKELTELLKAFDVQAASEKLEVIEDGEDFMENAAKKASAYFDKFSAPVISDDSGLVVEALPNELGVHSARFGGEGLTDRERAELLLEKMKGVENRDCYFICYLCVILSEQETYFFEGRLKGKIAHEYKGEHGFGYDPVFIPLAFNDEGKTVAQAPEWKMLNSHRAVASARLNEFFEEQQRN